MSFLRISISKKYYEMFHRYCAAIILTLTTLIATGQQDSSSSDKGVKIFPIPIAFYTPETGLGLGAGVTSVIETPDGNFSPRKSQLTFGAAYTTLKQVLVYLPFNLYLADQKIYTTGELGYFDYTFRYFGMVDGTTPDDPEFYRAKFPRLRLNTYYQVNDGLFIGTRWVYDRFKFAEFESGGRLEEGDVSGSTDHRVITFGLGTILDQRDNNLFPTSGFYGEFSADLSVNENYNYQLFKVDVSTYLPISDRGTVAINLYSENLVGMAPFTAYPRLGGTKKLRGYIEGAILQKSVNAFQIEARQMIKGRVGMAAFMGFGIGANSIELAAISNTQIAGGLGIRVQLTDKLNARVDYAKGLLGRSGFYITFGEAF